MTGRIGLPDVARDEGPNGPAPAHCKLCTRPLDVAGVEDSRDCGGDCWGCIRVIEELADPDVHTRAYNFMVQAEAAERMMEGIIEEHEVMEVAARYSAPEGEDAVEKMYADLGVRLDMNADLVGKEIPNVGTITGSVPWSTEYVLVQFATGGFTCRSAKLVRATLASQNDLPYTEGRKGGNT